MISRFTIGFSRTFNLGNFESMRVEASITVDVPEDGSFSELKTPAQQQLRLLMEETYRAQNPKTEKKTA